ncbi:MAG: tRNA pseudouridine(55) synthase TruB [Burkholderiales bacterium]|nr:tRNA pseudouridine(55) synthase TruB [Burkholderiales bacterium]
MKRRVDGVLLLDKPAGMTSNAALQRVKRLYQAAKAGHTGTLDPFATGLLPICLGEATKFAHTLLTADKTYRAVIRLGVRTTTGDPEGAVIATRPVAVTEPQVRALLPRFTGAIEQTPPMHSAIKRGGRPLYEYARQGLQLERQPRRVMVYRLELLELTGEYLGLLVHCGKGFYVRTLADELGEALGCGAHLHALTRLAVDGLRLEAATGLAELEAMPTPDRLQRLLPTDALLQALPRLELGAEAAWQLSQGQAIWHPGLRVGEQMRAYGPDGRFLGLVEVNEEGKAAPKRLVVRTPAQPDPTGT